MTRLSENIVRLGDILRLVNIDCHTNGHHPCARFQCCDTLTYSEARKYSVV